MAQKGVLRLGVIMVRRVLVVLALAVVPFVAIPTALAPGAGAAPPGPVLACMNNGWQTFREASGQPFRNQGQCIAYQIHHPVSFADLASSSFNGTVSAAVAEGLCPGPPPDFVYLIFDAVYPGSTSVGNVNLQVAGCFNLLQGFYSGTFTITTNVGTLSGNAAGPVTFEGSLPTVILAFPLALSINAETGSFTGTTGALQFSATTPFPSSEFVGTVTAS